MSFLLKSAFFIFRWPGFLITETHTDMKSERGQRQSSGGVLQKRCSAEKVFLEISQNSQEKHLCQKKGKRDLKNFKFIKKDILARVLPCEFCEISKNTFFYRIPPVAASTRCGIDPKFHQNLHTRWKPKATRFGV